MVTKLVDSKGRLMLGNRFAGRMVLVDDTNPDCITITAAVAIPENEAWLYKNEAALNKVRTGLQQARNGEFSENPPDLDNDASLADRLE